MTESAEGLRHILDRITPKIQARPSTPEELKIEELMRRRNVEDVMVEIGIPRRLFGATFDAALAVPAIIRMHEFVEVDVHIGRCLVLSGPPGVGKTYAAVAALNAMVGTPRRMYYFGDLCALLLEGGRDRHEALETIKRIRFLILDDFGVEYVKPGGLMEAFTDALFYHREAQCLPTVITTNLLPEELRARLSKRIIDRLRGDWGEVFSVPGESLRGRKDRP